MIEIHFYSAYVKTNINEPFKFELEEIKIKKVYGDGTIELEYPRLYSSGNKSCLFSGRRGRAIDEEINLFYGKIYYSTDKNKCKDFLLEKIREQNELADKIRERMRESKLEIKLLEEGK